MIHLNERETKIFKLIADGFTSKEIARNMGIEFRTVESYAARIKKKLGARNIANAVFIACQSHGMVRLAN